MNTLPNDAFQYLETLPVYTPFGCDSYAVQGDGTVTLPDGRKLQGLTPGYTVKIPRQLDRLKAMSHDIIAFWTDAHGQSWRTVMTDDGLKRMPMR